MRQAVLGAKSDLGNAHRIRRLFFQGAGQTDVGTDQPLAHDARRLVRLDLRAVPGQGRLRAGHADGSGRAGAGALAATVAKMMKAFRRHRAGRPDDRRPAIGPSPVAAEQITAVDFSFKGRHGGRSGRCREGVPPAASPAPPAAADHLVFPADSVFINHKLQTIPDYRPRESPSGSSAQPIKAWDLRRSGTFQEVAGETAGHVDTFDDFGHYCPVKAQV